MATVLDWRLVTRYGARDNLSQQKLDGEILCELSGFHMWWEARQTHLAHYAVMHGMHVTSKQTYKFLDTWRAKRQNLSSAAYMAELHTYL